MTQLFGTLIQGKNTKSNVYKSVNGADVYVNYVTHNPSEAQSLFKTNGVKHTDFVELGAYLGTACEYKASKAAKTYRATGGPSGAWKKNLNRR